MIRLLTLFLLIIPSFGRSRSAHIHARDIRVINKSGLLIDIFWINPNTRELAHSNTDGQGCPYGGDVTINSFVGHEFQITELPPKGKTRCIRPTCQATTIQVTLGEDQHFTLGEDFEISYEDSAIKARKESTKALAECKPDLSLPPLDQIEQLATCMKEKAEHTIRKKEEEISFQGSIRKAISEKLVDYACTTGEKAMNSTKPLEEKEMLFGSRKFNKPSKVNIIFETKTTQVLLIDDFVNADQCSSADVLSTKSGDGKTIILPPSAQKDSTINQLMRKIMDVGASFKLPMKWIMNVSRLLEIQTLVPREDLDDKPPAEVGVETASDELMARLIIFCKVPSSGGALHFRKSGVHLQTKDALHKALLIMYRDPLNPDEVESEKLLDEYLICPPADEMTLLVEDFQ